MVARHLIVNADDFGLSVGVNRGIIQAHEKGIVTSASLMVRMPAAEDAAHYGRSHAQLSLGLHLDLGEWQCVDEMWTPVYQVVPWDEPQAIEAEVQRQLDRFRQLVGADPTHLDSHQHFHRKGAGRQIVAAMAQELGVPLRQVIGDINYSGHFYGQTARGTDADERITCEALMRILSTLPSGVTELACHPGLDDELPCSYSSQREVELRVLCDPQVQRVIADQKIVLWSFTDYLASFRAMSAMPTPAARDAHSSPA